jgi:hypothetical protein
MVKIKQVAKKRFLNEVKRNIFKMDLVAKDIKREIILYRFTSPLKICINEKRRCQPRKAVLVVIICEKYKEGRPDFLRGTVTIVSKHGGVGRSTGAF